MLTKTDTPYFEIMKSITVIFKLFFALYLNLDSIKEEEAKRRGQAHY